MKVIVRKLMNEYTPYAVILVNEEAQTVLQHFTKDLTAYSYAAEVANVLKIHSVTFEKQFISCVEISNEEFFK